MVVYPKNYPGNIHEKNGAQHEAAWICVLFADTRGTSQHIANHPFYLYKNSLEQVNRSSHSNFCREFNGASSKKEFKDLSVLRYVQNMPCGNHYGASGVKVL
jgi:hypothetical protein